MTTGERIKEARLRAGLKQNELADMVHVTKYLMYKYEKGLVKNIPYNVLENIANACHVTPAYLAGWETKTKSGTWIHDHAHQTWACSECQTTGSPQWKRCPVCEAKMHINA